MRGLGLGAWGVCAFFFFWGGGGGLGVQEFRGLGL